MDTSRWFPYIFRCRVLGQTKLPLNFSLLTLDIWDHGESHLFSPFFVSAQDTTLFSDDSDDGASAPQRREKVRFENGTEGTGEPTHHHSH